MTTIYLVRHGLTDYIGKCICGYLPGVHLNDTGKAQAERAAEYLSSRQIKAIFASPLERTMETAAFLARKLDLHVTPLDSLKAINFGELQGLGEELNSLPVWQQFLTHPAEVHFPGGESIKDGQMRIVKGLIKLAAEASAENPIVCYSHCEILRLAIVYALHIPLDDYQRLTIDPGSITCLEWDKGIQTIKMLNFVP